jgi:hypothetical protein
VARSDADAESDIDILVDLEPGRSLLDLGGLLVDLRAALERDVDVVVRSGLPPASAGSARLEPYEMRPSASGDAQCAGGLASTAMAKARPWCERSVLNRRGELASARSVGPDSCLGLQCLREVPIRPGIRVR